MTRAELIAAIEAATGPSREWDAAIHLEVYTAVALPDAPPYTASIDAALTLVPEGFAWQIRRGNANDGEIYSNAQLWRFGDPRDEDGKTFWSSHTLPALALCAAALRASADKGE